MKIIKLEKEKILFDNNKAITINFLPKLSKYLPRFDFRKIDIRALDINFDETTFKITKPSHICFGFEFGDAQQTIFVHLYRTSYNPYYDEDFYHYVNDVNRMKSQNFDFKLMMKSLNEMNFEIKYGDTVFLELTESSSFIEISAGTPYRINKHIDSSRMTIQKICEDYVEFSNGKKITFDHCSDCCEHNYADFLQIDDLGKTTVYYESDLVFEPIEGAGFRFGNRGGLMTFVPCYSWQNGYYTHCLDIYYDGKLVIHLKDAELEIV